MKKLGIVVDSSCGLTKKEAEARGWYFLPLYLYINDKEYEDGITITADEYYKTISVDQDTKTAATSPGVIGEVLKVASAECENVLVYTISNALSAQQNIVKMSANDFDNVYVVESKSVGNAIVVNLEAADRMIETEAFSRVYQQVNQWSRESFGLVIPETMDWLVKGGRASSSAASMAKLLKIVPIISLKDGKLESYGKGRVFRKTVVKIAKTMLAEHPNATSYGVYNARNTEFSTTHRAALQTIMAGKKLIFSDMPPVITNHIGLGAMAIIAIYSNE